MGEARTDVNLSNAFDLALVRRGQLTPDKVRRYKASALVDTGSMSTVLPVHVVQKLGLIIAGQRVAQYADGRNDAVDMTEPVNIDIDGRDTTEETLVLGDEVIIGQTVLEKLDLLVDCVNRRVIPNPAHPDQPVLKVK